MNSLLERITIQPDICHGKPVIRGLRYPVESVLEYLAAGDSFEDVLAEFPDLGRDASHIRPDYRKIATASHSIFYRKTEDGVLIVRVLRQRMDFVQHL